MDKKKMYIGAGAAVGVVALAAVFLTGGDDTGDRGTTTTPRVTSNVPTTGEVKETPKVVERDAPTSSQSSGSGRLTSSQAQEAPEDDLEPSKKKKKKGRKSRRTPRKKRAQEEAEMPDIEIPEAEKRERAKRF